MLLVNLRHCHWGGFSLRSIGIILVVLKGVGIVFQTTSAMGDLPIWYEPVEYKLVGWIRCSRKAGFAALLEVAKESIVAYA